MSAIGCSYDGGTTCHAGGIVVTTGSTGIACHRSSCRHNVMLECTAGADEIDVDRCLDFRPA